MSEVDRSFGVKVMSVFVFAYCSDRPLWDLENFHKIDMILYMVLGPLKRVQKNFKVNPNLGAKVMRVFVFTFCCKTHPELRKFFKKSFFWSNMNV